MEFEELFNQMVKALGIIIDKRLKERPHKIENKTIEEIGRVVPF